MILCVSELEMYVTFGDVFFDVDAWHSHTSVFRVFFRLIIFFLSFDVSYGMSRTEWENTIIIIIIKSYEYVHFIYIYISQILSHFNWICIHTETYILPLIYSFVSRLAFMIRCACRFLCYTYHTLGLLEFDECASVSLSLSLCMPERHMHRAHTHSTSAIYLLWNCANVGLRNIFPTCINQAVLCRIYTFHT